ncbi:MAG: amidohydrolase [Chloroflexi bacterium]|nr:amidohydrolase [Chloroflexota bacterium]
MTEILERTGVGRPSEVTVEVVDVDVHPEAKTADELRPYISDPWRGMPDQMVRPIGSPLYVPPHNARRLDAYSPKGGPPCSDPEFTEQQLFGDARVDYALLIPLTVRPMANPEHEAAIASAVNAWLAETWLGKYNGHGRYHAAIVLPTGSPELAVREIDKWGDHPYFVEVMLGSATRAPYGQPQFYPIYQAAVRHDLPVAVHVTRAPGMGLLTPVGYVSYLWEHHCLYPLIYGTHLISMLCEGIFERFPTLKVAFIEGGFGWLPPLLWRLDQHWNELRLEVPGLKRKPSEYLRDHLRFSSQPIEEPPDPRQLQRVLELMDAEHTLMFSTDYPHWDGDYDPRGLFRHLSPSARRRILCENALELYGLPPTRTA